MKKAILLAMIAFQSTSAFATIQVLNCKGIQSDELGEMKKAVSAVIKIVNPSIQSLLVINGEAAASERASIQVSGLPAIQIDGINVTNMRKAIHISGYSKNSFMLSVYVPVPSLGKEGTVEVNMSRVTSNNESFYTELTCVSTLENCLQD